MYTVHALGNRLGALPPPHACSRGIHCFFHPGFTVTGDNSPRVLSSTSQSLARLVGSPPGAGHTRPLAEQLLVLACALCWGRPSEHRRQSLCSRYTPSRVPIQLILRRSQTEFPTGTLCVLTERSRPSYERFRNSLRMPPSPRAFRPT